MQRKKEKERESLTGKDEASRRDTHGPMKPTLLLLSDGQVMGRSEPLHVKCVK